MQGVRNVGSKIVIDENSKLLLGSSAETFFSVRQGGASSTRSFKSYLLQERFALEITLEMPEALIKSKL